MFFTYECLTKAPSRLTLPFLRCFGLARAKPGSTDHRNVALKPLESNVYQTGNKSLSDNWNLIYIICWYQDMTLAFSWPCCRWFFSLNTIYSLIALFFPPFTLPLQNPSVLPSAILHLSLHLILFFLFLFLDIICIRLLLVRKRQFSAEFGVRYWHEPKQQGIIFFTTVLSRYLSTIRCRWWWMIDVHSDDSDIDIH